MIAQLSISRCLHHWKLNTSQPTLGQRQRYLVIAASQFQSILDRKPRAPAIYKGCDVATLSNPVRGKVVEQVVRNTCAILDPASAFSKPELGNCSNGAKRGHWTAEYDWLHNGKRIECKSSRLHWNSSSMRWYISFQKVKFLSFDELLVAFYTPDTLHVYRHDCHFGVSERGRDTKLIGHAIHIRGPCGVEDWQTAEVIILGKLNSSSNDCQHIASLPLEDPQFADALKKCTSPSLHHANAMRTNVPLIHHTAPFRVLVIEQVVFALDRMVSRDGVSFTRHIGDELTFNGKQRRGNHQQTCDW